jgi:PAS domain S-box-containing protein
MIATVALKQTLSHLILGQKGGQNRIQIIELLKERPYNLNQLAEILDLNYRTIKHHVDTLLKNELVSTSHAGSYGKVYFLTPEMEGNMDIFEDILKKFELSKKLADFTSSPKFFQNVMKQLNDALIILTRDGQVFFWNDSASNLYGHKKDDILGNTVQIFKDSKTQKASLKKAEKGKKTADLETKGMHKSGKDIDVSVTVDSIKDEKGKVIGYSILSRDISARKKAEMALQASEERFRRFFEGGPEYCYMVSPEGIILDVNESALNKLGYDKRELVGKPLKTIYAPESQKKLDSLFKKWKKNTNLENEEMSIITKSGKVRNVLLSAGVARDENGKILHSMSVQRDITDRKKAEDVLRDSEAELSAILDNAPIPMFLVDEDRKVRKVNSATIDFAGRPAEEMIGLRGGDALKCLHSLDDPKGCGFGDHCEKCEVRLTVIDTFKTGKGHRQVEATLPFDRGDNDEELNLLISTALLTTLANRKVLVCVEDVTKRQN